MELEEQYRILRKQTKWAKLFFYQKTDVLYQLTFKFTKEYLMKHGDKTSMEMEIKLLNAARGSVHELREDYEDYLKTRHLALWNERHPRWEKMQQYCKTHNRWEDYEPLIEKMNAEELANTALTLCHMVDKMMTSYQKKLEKEFVTEGGIRERMTAARLGYRTNQQQEIAQLKQQLEQANQRIAELEAEIKRLKG